MEDKNIKKHDSYGSVSLSKITGFFDLFGSQISINTAIALRINEADQVEYFGKVKHRTQGRIIEVLLTPNQFSELITTMNVGEGVPCTIDWLNGKGSIKREERPNSREVTESMLSNTISELVKRIEEIKTNVEDLKNKSSVSKKDKEQLIFDLNILENHLKSNIPFVEKVFKEVMDKAVSEAKADIDATVTHAINAYGLEELKNRNLLSEK